MNHSSNRLGAFMKYVDFYFDFLSPFSFFAWKNLPALKKDLQSKGQNVEFKYYPVIMAKLFSANGIKGPGEVPSKRDFLFRQMLRYAKSENIPFTTPKSHPFNPLYALRMATIECAKDLQEQVIDSIFTAGWTRAESSITGIDLGDPDQLVAVLNKDGLDGESLLARSYQKEVKQALMSNVVQALECQVFGVPTFVTSQEIFWGNDSIPQLKDSLLGCDNLDSEQYQVLLRNIIGID